jgi:hypothetical protein
MSSDRGKRVAIALCGQVLLTTAIIIGLFRVFQPHGVAPANHPVDSAEKKEVASHSLRRTESISPPVTPEKTDIIPEKAEGSQAKGLAEGIHAKDALGEPVKQKSESVRSNTSTPERLQRSDQFGIVDFVQRDYSFLLSMRPFKMYSANVISNVSPDQRQQIRGNLGLIEKSIGTQWDNADTLCIWMWRNIMIIALKYLVNTPGDSLESLGATRDSDRNGFVVYKSSKPGATYFCKVGPDLLIYSDSVEAIRSSLDTALGERRRSELSLDSDVAISVKSFSAFEDYIRKGMARG